MLRLTALTALVLGLLTFSRVEAQEDPPGVHAPIQNLETHIAQIEIQAKLSKLKKLLEAIAKHELELATNPDEHFQWRAGKLEERQKAETQLQSLLKLYPNADGNKDGWLTQQEVRELFPDADADGDGKVTPVEIRNYLAKQEN
jgi:Ca2+-binding EF-hand superfamily protein